VDLGGENLAKSRAIADRKRSNWSLVARKHLLPDIRSRM
jgi:hypothetical protein